MKTVADDVRPTTGQRVLLAVVFLGPVVFVGACVVFFAWALLNAGS